ncbi:TIGR02594 family protein [Pseudomonas sp. Teo4]|uniref:TIGR02594 family protein n=1 Tax=Pseudomonas sp. Teo4 TaxID=3064528 RepID=UPI002ABB8AFF|nr:TIGR02594 family protein [Pseudomonas sp. Teo4]MDZ3991942.1 hypothetical protein [Pseudomonas sp. Teo4]
MLDIIDCPNSLTSKIPTLRTNGVKVVIRYYNHKNSRIFPTKCLEPAEAAALDEAGIALATVFEQRAGAGGHVEDFGTANGTRDGTRAKELAKRLRQPEGSAIYFAVDWDFVKAAELSEVEAYFHAVNGALNGDYRVGVYGSGKVAAHLLDNSLASLVWLSGSLGWSGTRQMLATDRWALFQKALERNEAGISHDGNIASPAFSDFGQFHLGGANAPEIGQPASTPLALMRVTARSGLNLRRGPGREFTDIDTLPLNTVVRALGRNGDWIKVDREGDGVAEGFMFAEFLAPVAGGLPLPAPTGSQPLDIALAELAAGIAEVPGPGNNPRILLYHSTTTLHATQDSVAWCSSFVNYCVTQAGMHGTNSAGAQSWHTSDWGIDVTQSPHKGDIVVFSRTGGGASPGSGHVGFWLDSGGGMIKVLGGNQGDRVSIDTFPEKGKKGPFTYKLLSIRRG